MANKVFVILTMLVLALVTPVSQAAAAQGFNSTYNASSGKFPDQVCPPWTLGDAASEDPSLSGGKLIISTSENSEDMFYRQTAPDIDVPDPLVIEFRMKFVSGSSSNAARLPFGVNFVTSPVPAGLGKGNSLFIGADEIFLLESRFVKGPSASVDTNDAFHTYRIEVTTATGAIKVFYDGVLTLEGSIFEDIGSDLIQINFGEGSGATFGTFEVEFFRHNASTVSCVDHFLSYKGKVTTGFQAQNVTLKDQFDDPAGPPQNVTVKKPASLYNPAEKTFNGNTEPITDPDTHLLGYKIKQEALHEPVTGITVKNQFHPAGISVDTIKPDRLLVPTAKDLLNPVPEPDPDTHSVDHYKCYKVKVTPGTPKLPKGIQASVKDQFNEVAKLFDIKKPSRLCNPVDKGGEGIKNEAAHLMCYKVKPATKHTPVTGIHVNNQFGAEQLDTIKEEELCVPSEKIHGD